MENDPRLTPPLKIWNFPYVSSLFFLKASLTYRTESRDAIASKNWATFDIILSNVSKLLQKRMNFE